MSSARDGLAMECCRLSVVRGFVYRMNKMGPRTDPCGMPKLSMDGCESLLLIITVSSVRKVGSEPVERCTRNSIEVFKSL